MSRITKQETVKRLELIDLKKVKDETIRGMIDYTLKVYRENPRNVEVEDLKILLAEMKEAKVELPPLEKQALVAEVKKEEPVEEPKPKAKKPVAKKSKPTPKAEEPKVEEPEAKAEAKVEEPVKKVSKPKAKPKAKVEPKAEAKAEPKAKPKAEPKKAKAKKPELPAEIDLNGRKIVKKGLLKDHRGSDAMLYTTMEISPELLHDPNSYNDLGFVPKKLKSLPNNLDILSIVWETNLVVYAVSVYTQVFYTFLGKEANNLPVYVEA